MPTSTVYTTNKGRFDERPRKRCLIVSQAAADANLEEIDDTEERTSRNLLRMMDEANKFSSPRGTPDRRQSVSSAGMTNAQIAEHYTNCLKLSAENRINLKNAFDLHLIDLMSSILTNGDANFQTASSTIDAGAKIYAYRVDSLHRETYRVYSGLGKGSKHTPDDNEDMDMKSPFKENNQPSNIAKRTKKLIRGSCIETNERALNIVCNESKFQTDALFDGVRASFEEGNALGLFLNTLSSVDDNSELVLHSIITPSTSRVRALDGIQSPSLCFTHTDFETSSAFHGQICCQLADFTFTWRVPNIKNLDSSFLLPLPQKKKFAAVESGFSHNSFNDVENDDLSVLNDSVRMDNELADEKNLKLNTLEAGISCNDLEYSYFDASVLAAFVGPNHWKVSAKSRKINELNKSVKKAIIKPRKLMQKNERIDFSQVNDFKTLLASSKSVSTRLTEACLLKHQVESRTFETKAIADKACVLNALFLKPEQQVDRPHQRTESADEQASEGQDQDHDSALFGLDDVPDNKPAPPGTDTELHLVDQPNKVAAVDIQYVRHARRIDVRRVKQAMWSVLSGAQPDAPYTSPLKQTKQKLMQPTRLFSSVLHDMAQVLPVQIRKNLTVHTAFNLLLHMCNEKDLDLVQNENGNDLEIRTAN